MSTTNWVAVIEHKYGNTILLSRTDDGIRRQLHDYVKTYWEDWVDIPISGNPEADIDVYFDAAEGFEELRTRTLITVID